MIFETFDLLPARWRVVYDMPYLPHEILVWHRGSLRHPTSVEHVSAGPLSPPLQILTVRDAVYEYELVLAYVRKRYNHKDVRVVTSLQGTVRDTNPISYLKTQVTMGIWMCDNPEFADEHEGTRRPEWFHFAAEKLCDPPSKLCPTAWEHIQKNIQGT